VTGEAKLTLRERQVLELARAGLGDEQIAGRLGIARSTVGFLLVAASRKDAASRGATAADSRRRETKQ
jgi:DNA-binding CsgD family transcriptional regulator